MAFSEGMRPHQEDWEEGCKGTTEVVLVSDHQTLRKDSVWEADCFHFSLHILTNWKTSVFPQPLLD